MGERLVLIIGRMLIHSQHSKWKLPSFQRHHFLLCLLPLQHPFFQLCRNKRFNPSRPSKTCSCIHIRPLINHANTVDMHISTQSDALLTIHQKPDCGFHDFNSIYWTDLYQHLIKPCFQSFFLLYLCVLLSLAYL